MQKEGIKSYNHLNEVILLILEETGTWMAAREINDRILNRYTTGKVRINGVKIAKRLRGRDNVKVRYGKDGLCYYKYVEE